MPFLAEFIFLNRNFSVLLALCPFAGLPLEFLVFMVTYLISIVSTFDCIEFYYCNVHS